MSTLRVTTLANADGTKRVFANTVVDGTAKKLVNFNKTDTVAIRSRFNASSINDNEGRDYTLDFTIAMSDTNHAAVFGWENTFKYYRRYDCYCRRH